MYGASIWTKDDSKCDIPCIIIMVHRYRLRAVLTGRLTVSGFDLAWFSSLSSKRLCVFGLNGDRPL